ncbi:MAG: hypothetical protein V4584_06565 [Verrucomicrobiota bacterium]
MVTSIKPTSVLLGLALALGSCAPPKAAVIAPAPVVKKEPKKEPEPVVSEPLAPALPDDGMPMPDMLAMPSDSDFRATNPKTGTQSGAVISRPPTDPPSRVKSKPAE